MASLIEKKRIGQKSSFKIKSFSPIVIFFVKDLFTLVLIFPHNIAIFKEYLKNIAII